MIRFLLLLSIIVFGSAVGEKPPVVLVLGDSLSAAYGLAVDQGWVNLLQQKLTQSGYPHQVVNASVSGDTTSNGLTRIERALKAHEPDIVIVELGGNDGLRAQPIPMIRGNLEKIIERSRATGAKIIITGMRLPPNYGSTYVDQFEAIYPDLASRHGSVLVPFFMAGVATRPELMQPDGVHPTARAQEILLENVWPYLQPQLEAMVRGDATEQ